jgi:hypothetical protein
MGIPSQRVPTGAGFMTGHGCGWLLRGVLLGVVLVVGFGVLFVGGAGALVGPGWGLRSVAYPTDFSVADTAGCVGEPASVAYEFCDTYMVAASNVGSRATGAAATVVLRDVVPAGLVVRGVALFFEQEGTGTNVGEQFCKTVPVECVIPLKVLGHAVLPDSTLRMYVSVSVPSGLTPKPLSNVVSVAASGTKEVTAEGANTLEMGTPEFGLSLMDTGFVEGAGEPDVLAGGHPYEFDTEFGFNSVLGETPQALFGPASVEDLRDVSVDLPVGMAGSGVSAPQCTLARLASKGATKGTGKSGCPEDTIIGHIRTLPENNAASRAPIYNLVPETGVAVELGFVDLTGSTHVLYATLVPSRAGYVLRTTSQEIPQIALSEVVANVFGNPGVRDGGAAGPSTFTNPSDCDGEPLVTTVIMDSWQHPGTYNPDGTPNLADPDWKVKSTDSPPVTGCEQLEGLFEPSITAAPTTARAGSPSGLDFALTVPQNTGPEEQATPPLRDTTITLPEGLVVNPSSANGLAACSLAEAGFNQAGEPDASPAKCPDASKLGSVEVETPSLPSEVCKAPQIPLEECPQPSEREHTMLTGNIYLAAQNENPFHSLIAIYIAIEDPRTGIIAKLAGKVTPNPSTGQLTATVTDSPQFPFTQLRTKFFPGDTAALTTPAECGTYTTTSSLSPWSAPQSGPAVTPASSFTLSEAPGGGPCAAATFRPVFAAGTLSTLAREHTSLAVTFSRQDSEQPFHQSAVSTPLGLLGTINGIPQCSEAQANNGTCGDASLLGHAATAVGSGPDPYWVKNGKVYLTGPYEGAPFGLSIVVPTTAGPFTLTGNAGYGREVVRAAIQVNPHTDQITVQSDPLPTIIEGIPLQIRTVNVNIDRSGFIFNPTNCNELQTTALFTSTTGTTSTTSVPYYASGCAALPFKPTITASTTAHTSRPNGASLTLNIDTHPGEANIAATELQIPAALPAREPTLHHACLAKTFETNPAVCPAESIVGTATVHTPILANPLTGPIYLVSYGNEGFPRTSIVLQGENGLTTILEGHTDIKHSITYSRFTSVPDVPFTTFTADLPTGPHSILGAYLPNTNNNPCGHTLTLPIHTTGQNNKQHNPLTPILVTGCPTRPTIQNTTTNSNMFTLTLYTPQTGTLHITSTNPHINQTIHTTQNHNQTLRIHLPTHHPNHINLTLTQTTPNHHKTTTHTTTTTTN